MGLRHRSVDANVKIILEGRDMQAAVEKLKSDKIFESSSSSDSISGAVGRVQARRSIGCFLQQIESKALLVNGKMLGTHSAVKIIGK